MWEKCTVYTVYSKTWSPVTMLQWLSWGEGGGEKDAGKIRGKHEGGKKG